MLGQGLFAGVIATLVALGLYWASRFLPEAVTYGRSVSAYSLRMTVTVIDVGRQLTERSFEGRVRVGSETWRARLDTETPHVHDTLRVTGAEGLTLVCGPQAAIQVSATVAQRPFRLLSELGRVLASLLCVILSSISLLALMAPPVEGLVIFGLFAPFSVILALIAAGSPSQGSGFTVRGLRATIAVTCGPAIFAAMTFGFVAALGAVVSALILAAFDPSLGAMFLLLGAGGNDA